MDSEKTYEQLIQEAMVQRGETREQIEAGLREYGDMVAKEFAKRWVAGEAPQFMYEPPFYRGMIFTNRNTGEEVRVESTDARQDFGL